jgi:hypothetical protein
MTSLDGVTAWIDHYRQAWATHDPKLIADLFTEDAAYFRQARQFTEWWMDQSKSS